MWLGNKRRHAKYFASGGSFTHQLVRKYDKNAKRKLTHQHRETWLQTLHMGKLALATLGLEY